MQGVRAGLDHAGLDEEAPPFALPFALPLADGAQPPPIPWASRAVFHGLVVCARVPRTTLAEGMPREIALMHSADALDWHPVLFAIGEQTRGASRFGAGEIEWGTHYEELVAVIPFVTTRRSASPCVLAAGMSSSHGLANWMGSAGYGYDKRSGRLERRGPIHAFVTADRGLSFQAVAEPRDDWCPASACAALPVLQRVVGLPWIGRRPGGTWVRSDSRWEIGGAAARPIDAHVELPVPFGRHVPAGAFASLPDASFEVRDLVWRLGFPRAFAP